MGDISRFVEAAIITTVFAAGVVWMNYSAWTACDHNRPVTARIDRGPSRVAASIDASGNQKRESVSFGLR